VRLRRAEERSRSFGEERARSGDDGSGEPLDLDARMGAPRGGSARATVKGLTDVRGLLKDVKPTPPDPPAQVTVVVAPKEPGSQDVKQA
jgi:hypothetical protein